MSRKDIDARLFADGYFGTGTDRHFGITIVTMPTCGKCKALLARAEELDATLPAGYCVYNFDGEDAGMAVLQDLGISSAPIAVYVGPDGKKTARHVESLKELDDFANSLESILGD